MKIPRKGLPQRKTPLRTEAPADLAQRIISALTQGPLKLEIREGKPPRDAPPDEVGNFVYVKPEGTEVLVTVPKNTTADSAMNIIGALRGKGCEVRYEYYVPRKA